MDWVRLTHCETIPFHTQIRRFSLILFYLTHVWPESHMHIKSKKIYIWIFNESLTIYISIFDEIISCSQNIYVILDCHLDARLQENSEGIIYHSVVVARWQQDKNSKEAWEDTAGNANRLNQRRKNMKRTYKIRGKRKSGTVFQEIELEVTWPLIAGGLSFRFKMPSRFE